MGVRSFVLLGRGCQLSGAGLSRRVRARRSEKNIGTIDGGRVALAAAKALAARTRALEEQNAELGRRLERLEKFPLDRSDRKPE